MFICSCLDDIKLNLISYQRFFTNNFLLILFQVTKEELAKLVQGFDKQEILTSGGVTLAGSRYIYLSGSDRVVRAKLGRNGVHCMKTQQGKWSSSETI